MTTITYEQTHGDVNPLEYGGTFLGSDGMSWHLVTNDADHSLREDEIRVYRWDAKFLSPFDWVKWDQLKSTMDVSKIPESPHEQSVLVGEYHGFHELDSYPEQYSRKELKDILGI